MEPWMVAAGAGLVAAVVAWILGSRSGRSGYRRSVEALARDVRTGKTLPDRGVASDEPGEVREIRHALAEAWRPGAGPAAEGGAEVALARFAAFLRGSVADPLAEGLDQGGEGLRARASEVVNAVEDTEFFLEEPEPRFETVAVARPLQEVIHEFTQELDAPVKLVAPDRPVRARLATEAFKDAVYLILANAAHFSDGQAVEVRLEEDGGRLVVRIRDRGPGFTPEALERAIEPFFSTDPGALGLGLSHARRIVEMHAGELRLGNREGGGGEVEIVIPQGG